MGMVSRIYNREDSGSLPNPASAKCATAAPPDMREEKEIHRSSIAENVVDRVKTARRAMENSYRLERFAELGDRNPEVLEMLEIARDMNLL